MEQIRQAMLRVRQLLRLKPERGRRTIASRVVLGDGLRATVHDGDWTVPVDMSPNSGGDGSAPDPGVYARAALAACVAIVYRMWASAEGIALEEVEVAVEADNDAAGLFGAGEARPAYRAVRLAVTVTADVPEPVLLDLLARAEAHSPYLDLFRHGVPVEVTRSVRRIAQTSGVSS